MKSYFLLTVLLSLGVSPAICAQEAHAHDSHPGENCCGYDHVDTPGRHHAGGELNGKLLHERALQAAAGQAAHHHDHANCSGHEHAAEGEHDHANCSGHEHAAEGVHDHAHCGGHEHAAEGEHDHTNCCGHEHAAEGEHDHTNCGGHEHAAEGEHDHANCSGHEHAAEGEHDHANCNGHEHGDTDAPVLVTADARSRQVLRMRVEEVPTSDLVLTHSLYGYLTATEHTMETYAMPCTGRISLAVKSAQNVKKGDILYSVLSPAVGEQVAELTHARSSLERCNAELATLKSRLEKLQSIGTANSELESQYKFKHAEQIQLVQGVAVAEARLKMLLMGTELSEQDGLAAVVVRANDDGTVRNVGINQGSWAEQGAAVVTMSNVEDLEIVATVYADDELLVEKVRATMPVGRDHVALEGTWRLDEQVNTEKQTRTLYFTPSELPQGAAAGRLCRLDLYAGVNDGKHVSIPDSAVVRVGLDDVVFVEVKEGTFAMVKVHAGASRRGMTPVAGLVPGQRIVVKGGAELRYLLPADGQKKKSAGHFHADGKFHEGEHH